MPSRFERAPDSRAHSARDTGRNASQPLVTLFKPAILVAVGTWLYLLGQEDMKCTVFILVVLFWVAIGCSPVQEVPPSADVSAQPAQSEEHSGILAQLERNHPEVFASILVYGTSPSGKMLCFRSRQGGTFVFKSESDEVERVVHAKMILRGQVKRITYSEGMFQLWGKQAPILSIGASE